MKNAPPASLLQTLVRPWAWLLLTGAVIPCAWAKDQPQWGERHSRNMVSQERGLPTDCDPKSGRNIRWMADLGTSTYSSPVVAGGRVLIGTNNGQPRDPRHQGDRGVLLCLDEETGRMVWQLLVPKLPRDPYLDCPGVGLTSSPAVEDGRVYLVSNRAEVMCLDLHGPGQRQQRPLSGRKRPRRTTWFRTRSAAGVGRGHPLGDRSST